MAGGAYATSLGGLLPGLPSAQRLQPDPSCQCAKWRPAPPSLAVSAWLPWPSARADAAMVVHNR